MRIAVLRETQPGERRVALVPESCKKLIQAGYEITVETGAGLAAGFPDQAYRDAGAILAQDPAEALGSAGLVLKVTAPATSAELVPKSATSWPSETRWPGCDPAPSTLAR